MPNKVTFNASFPEISRSQALQERAARKIPASTQTLAKGPGQYVRGVAPMFLQRGKGARVWDVDGNEFLDYNMGIGPISLGYAYDRVDEAIRGQLADGITFSLVHPLEVEVAELITSVVPGAECVRYSKTGADATTAAVRVARAFTGRKKVAVCGYHGWHDWYIGVTDRGRGIPEEVRRLSVTCNYNDIQSVADAVDSDTACVILEPVLFDRPKDGFLYKVRELCEKRGALLIFDEMWTGFRLALGGAQEYFDVRADIATFSKAVANGMPLSVVTGRADVMSLFDKEVFFFTTFGGEALSLAAAKATILEMKEKNVAAHLMQQGERLQQGYNEAAIELGMEYTQCVGIGCRTMVSFAPQAGDPRELKSLLQQELIKRGILWSGQHALSFSHDPKDIDYTIQAYRDALPVLKKAVGEGDIRKYLRGQPVEPVFRTLTGTPTGKAKS